MTGGKNMRYNGKFVWNNWEMPCITPIRIFENMSRIKSTFFKTSTSKNLKSNSFSMAMHTSVSVCRSKHPATGQQITGWNALDENNQVWLFLMKTTCRVASGTHCFLSYLLLNLTQTLTWTEQTARVQSSLQGWGLSHVLYSLLLCSV